MASSPLSSHVMRQHGLADVLRISAARTPDRLALVYKNQRLSYSLLDQTVDRTSNALRKLNIARGDRVALFSHNNASFVFLHFALARLGAISVPINFMLGPTEAAYILDHTRSRALVVEDMLVQVATAALAQCHHEVTIRGVILDNTDQCPAGWVDVTEWANYPDATPCEAIVADNDPIQIMYTSGTESRPKGATLCSGGFVAQYVSCIVNGEMNTDDVVIHSLPLYHCAQLHCFLSPGIMLGAVNILLRAPDPRAILASIEKERGSSLFCPPTVWIGLLNELKRERRDCSSLKKGYYGASAMPTEVLEDLLAVIPGLRLFNFYGQTEMAPLASVLGPDDHVRKLGSAGRPVINVQTRIVDDSDRIVAAGVMGEIVHRSPQLLLEYWNDPERTSEATRGGWFHSGDLGIMDEDGFLWVVDRKKDMIKSGGENVASREVEEVLYAHPAVGEVAVFGLPDPHWIEAVVAAVVLRPEQQVDEAILIQHCRERLAGFKTPKQIFLLDELPKNASGKILKRELRIFMEDRTKAGLPFDT